MVGEVKTGDSLGCNDHETAEFRILHGRSREIIRITNVDFKRAKFGLLKEKTHGLGIQKIGGSKRASKFSNIALSKLKIGASLLARSQAKGAGHLHE